MAEMEKKQRRREGTPVNLHTHTQDLNPLLSEAALGVGFAVWRAVGGRGESPSSPASVRVRCRCKAPSKSEPTTNLSTHRLG